MYNNMFGPGNCYDMTVDCNTNGNDMTCATADDFCYQNVEYLVDLYLNRDEYDIRYIMPDPFPPTYYIDYLNTPTVQAAIGAYVNYSESNNAVSKAFGNTGDDDREIGSVAAVKRILDSNVTVIMYFGDADYNCNWLGGQVVAHNIGAPGFEDAGFTNISTSDGKVHGQVRQAGTFAFVRIYESGHEVPFYKPLAALEMFERVVNGMDIETGETKISASYRTSGSKLSTYREGNRTVQLDVVGEDEDVVYDTSTDLPVFENGTSANTGPGSGGPPGERRVKRGVVDEKERKRREKRAKERKMRWRRRPSVTGRWGGMRRDELLGM
jgi:Serine carboxypeptidase